ncbi:family 16 glycosylhydrolase [Vibrio alfacsensis]|uniref:family 16 glycosylhydrolase n=1 Tax=Vibrio alfacsensis TaxID=1074311 RepID=UPI00406861BA
MQKNILKPLGLAVTMGLLAGCQSTGDHDGGTDFSLTKKPTVLTNTPVEPSDKWQLVWEDEFEGDKISSRNWSLEENCWGGGNNEQQCYTKRARNAFVQDGLLHIVAHKESFTGPDDAEGKPGANKTLPFTSARLRTKGKRDHKYGRFEIRAKLPTGQGTWPAFWMLPTDNKYGTWAASGEIDILEAVNLKAQSDAPGAKPGDKENRIYGSLHYGKKWPDNVYTGQAATLPDGVNPADGFHTYAIEWEEGEIRWYVDNIHYATQTADGWYSQYEVDGQLVNAKSPAPFDERFHLLLNLAVGGAWSANANEKGVDDNDYPKTLLVDSVKVYRCGVDRWKGKGCAAVGEQAIVLDGLKAPAILAQDDSYANGPLLAIFEDALNSSLAYGSYDPMNLIEHEEIDEVSRGKVLKITKQNGAGNIYFRSPTTDIRHWLETGELVFDIKVDEMTDGSELMVKTDSGWPKASDMTVTLPEMGQWGEVRIKLADLLAQTNRFVAGNQADPAAITNLLVFEPTAAMTFSLDNVRFAKP